MALLMVRRRVTKKVAMGRPVVEVIMEVDVVMPFESETVRQQDSVTP